MTCVPAAMTADPAAADPEALAALQARALPFPRPWGADEIAALLAGPGAILCTLGPRGFALGRALAGEAELLTLVVDPTLHRQGLGRRLLAAFEAAARHKGAQEAYLEVAADNQAACALYRAAGWRVRGLRKGYYKRPDGCRIDAHVLAKPLLKGPKPEESY